MTNDKPVLPITLQIEDFRDYAHECPRTSSIFRIGECIQCGEKHGEHKVADFCEVGAQSKADMMGLRWKAWNITGVSAGCSCGDEFETELDLAFHRAMIHDEEQLNDVELAVLAARSGIGLQ